MPLIVTLVAPTGDLGVEDCRSLREALRSAADEPGLLVVDLFNVTSIGDAVVQVLVGATARCAANGGRLVVANAGAQPWSALTRVHVAGAIRAHRRATPPLAELLELLLPER